MTKNILVSVAWPYANSQIHVGNIAGSICLPIYSPATSGWLATAS